MLALGDSILYIPPRTASFEAVPVQDCGRPSGLKKASIDGLRVQSDGFIALFDSLLKIGLTDSGRVRLADFQLGRMCAFGA